MPIVSEEKHATGMNPDPFIAKSSEAEPGLLSEREVEELSKSPEMAESSFLHGWRLRLTALG